MNDKAIESVVQIGITAIGFAFNTFLEKRERKQMKEIFGDELDKENVTCVIAYPENILD